MLAEQIQKVYDRISIFRLNMVSTEFTYEKAQKLEIDVLEKTFYDLQKPKFIAHNNEEECTKNCVQKNNLNSNGF